MKEVMAGRPMKSELKSERSMRVPHSQRLSAGKQAVRVLLPTFYAAILALLWWVVITDQQELARLAQDGRTADAQVTSMQVSHGKSNTYYLDYEFMMEGRRLTGTQSVSKEVYRRTFPGSHLTITYLPANPRLQRLGSVTWARVTDARRTGILILGPLSLCFVGLSCYVEYHFRSLIRKRSLA